jgi:hypothetical protein
MSEHERMLVTLGRLLEQIARPHTPQEELPVHIRTSLWQLGFQCSERTTREELIPRLWARKRSLLSTVGPEWGGPGPSPLSAA